MEDRGIGNDPCEKITCVACGLKIEVLLLKFFIQVGKGHCLIPGVGLLCQSACERHWSSTEELTPEGTTFGNLRWVLNVVMAELNHNVSLIHDMWEDDKYAHLRPILSHHGFHKWWDPRKDIYDSLAKDLMSNNEQQRRQDVFKQQRIARVNRTDPEKKKVARKRRTQKSTSDKAAKKKASELAKIEVSQDTIERLRRVGEDMLENGPVHDAHDGLLFKEVDYGGRKVEDKLKGSSNVQHELRGGKNVEDELNLLGAFGAITNANANRARLAKTKKNAKPFKSWNVPGLTAAWEAVKVYLSSERLKAASSLPSKGSSARRKTAKRKKTMSTLSKKELIRRLDLVWAELSPDVKSKGTDAANKADVDAKRDRKKRRYNNLLGPEIVELIKCYNSDGVRNAPKIAPDGVCFYRALSVLAFSIEDNKNSNVKYLINYNVSVREEIKASVRAKSQRNEWVANAPQTWRKNGNVTQESFRENAERLVAAVVSKGMPDLATRVTSGCLPTSAGWGGLYDFETILPALAFRDGQIFNHPLFSVGSTYEGTDYLASNTVVCTIIMTTPSVVNKRGIGEVYTLRMWKSLPSQVITLDTALWMAACYMPKAPPRIQRYVGNHYEVNIMKPEHLQKWKQLSEQKASLTEKHQNNIPPRHVLAGNFISKARINIGN